jgi:hypothetical protein
LISFKAPCVIERNFKATFLLKWIRKDVTLMLESGRERTRPSSVKLLKELSRSGSQGLRGPIPKPGSALEGSSA